MPSEPAYRRLEHDERRRRLLELGAELFMRHTYAELSMAKIARAAGISKALLYHYFPSKQDLFRATLAQQAEQLQQHLAPDDDQPPAEQLLQSLDAYLRWIEEHPHAYGKLLRTAHAVEEVRLLVDEQRDATVARIVGALDAPNRHAAEAAVYGWLWSIDGVCLRWIEDRDDSARTLDRGQVLGVLVAALLGALQGAGARLSAP